MNIQFTPPLGETVHLSISTPWPTCVNFTAALSLDDYLALKQEEIKVQLWSDIPSFPAWTASDFEALELPEPKVGAHSAAPVVVSLHNNHPIPIQTQSLSLLLAVPLSGYAKLTRSFTYRLVYPSGEIRWLGQFAQDGTLALDIAQDHDVILDERWTLGTSGYEWSSPNGDSANFEVARLARPSDYAIWAVGQGNSFDAEDASVVFLMPRLQSQSVAVPQAYAITATPDIRITISDHRTITASGAGSLHLAALDSRSVEVVGRALGHFPSITWHAATPQDTDPGYLLLTTPRNQNTNLRFALIPIASRRRAKFRVALDGLTAENNLARFSIASPANGTIAFFGSLAEQGGGTHVVFDVEPSGGEFSLSPVFDLTENLHVSILSDCRSVGQSFEGDSGVLPTPPPSPHLKPAADAPPALDRNTLGDGTPHSSSTVSTEAAKARTIRIPTTFRPHPVVRLSYVFLPLRFFFSVLTFGLRMIYGIVFGRKTARKKAQAGGNTKPSPLIDLPNIPAPDPKVGVVNSRILKDDVYSDTPPESVVSTLYLEVDGGIVRVALRSLDGNTTPINHISIDLDGHSPKVSHTELEGGLQLLEFDAGDHRVVKISHI